MVDQSARLDAEAAVYFEWIFQARQAMIATSTLRGSILALLVGSPLQIQQDVQNGRRMKGGECLVWA